MSAAAEFVIEPGVRYLNHGSFGPAVQAVLDVQQTWHLRLQREPMQFYVRELDSHLAAARGVLGEFVGAPADDLLFVDNATTGMNIAADSLQLEPGDEVLANDHEYGATLRIFERACQRRGAKLVVQPIPLPWTSHAALVEAFFAGVTPNTRVLLFSHVTSPTAVVFPAAEICRRARALGLTVCIDGPHALAMLPLELAKLDCDFYAASCHKWLSAPLGSGFLYVHPRWQNKAVPSLLSWGRPARGKEPSWRDEFGWLGTRNPSAYLSVPAAIEFLTGIGLAEFRTHGHELARYAGQQLGKLTGLPPVVPLESDAYGTMLTLPLPPGESEALQDALWEQGRIEVPIVSWNGGRYLRVSCHLYNTQAQYDELMTVLEPLLRQGL